MTAAILILSFLPCAATAEKSAADFYVSPQGQDAWSGRVPERAANDGPFATVQRAAQAVRELRKAQPDRKGPIVVQVRGGTYFLPDTWTLQDADSGTAASPTIYEAYPGETPILSGGVPIRGWQNDEAGRWRTKLPDVAAGEWNFQQLYVNDQRRLRPVLPRDGYYFVEAPVGGTQAGRQDRFQFADGHIRGDWRNLPDVEVLPFHAWCISRIPIAQVDAAQRIVTLASGTMLPHLYELNEKTWYRLENVVEAWQSPGQWYLDRTTGELGYLPLPGEELASVQVIAPRVKRLVHFQGRSGDGKFVEHVVLRGLTFAHAAWAMPRQGYSAFQAEINLEAAVQARDARHCSLESCVVRHTGAHGVWWGPGCRDCRIVGCELLDLGAGGILIGSGRFNEEPDEQQWAGQCVVRDNLVAHIGRVHPGGVGIWIGHAANNVVENNEVRDTYYSAVSVGWRWSKGASPAHHNTIAANDLHDIGQGVLSDMAGVYTLGESPGTVIRGNRIHHVRRSRYGGWGIYHDESSAQIVAEKNLAYDTEDAPFHLHHGRELTVRNNLFALGQNDQIKLTNMQKSGTLLLERNVFFWNSGRLFNGSPDDEITFRNNLYWQAGATEPIRFADGKSLEEWQKTKEPGAVVADPRFANPADGDFRLPADSPVTKIGFELFDVSGVGRVTKTRLTEHLPRVPATFPPAPPERPFRLRQDFELLAVDQGMPGFGQMAASRESNAHVTDETAADGKHSLKFTDSATGAVFFPHLYRDLKPHYEAGVWHSAMDVRVERGARPAFDWRDADPWYKNGPAFEVTADGMLKSNGQELLKVPHGQWFHVELTCGLGPQATGKYQMAVTLPGDREPRRFECNLPQGFKKLGWVGFSSLAYEPAVYYVDNLVFERLP